MARRSILLTALAIHVSGCLHHEPLVERGEAPDLLVFRNVRVFTGARPAAEEGADVLVREGRIEAVLPTGGAVPDGAAVVDGRGRTLLPGLVDLHVHVTSTSAPPWRASLPDPEHNLEAYLYAGVTTVCDLGGSVPDLDALRAAVDSGELLGPRIYRAGPIVTIAGGHPVGIVRQTALWPASAVIEGKLAAQIDTPADGVRVVDALLRQEVDLIKVAYDSLPPGAPQLERRHLLALVAAAHARGLPIVAHVRKAEDALTAALYGVDALVHGVSASDLPPGTADALGRTGVAVCPTLVSASGFDRLSRGEWRPYALAREVEHPSILEELEGPGVGSRMRSVSTGFSGFVDEIGAYRDRWAPNARAMFEAGVPLLAGTDSPMVGNVPGASLHEELRLLVAAGIPAGEVLLAATSRPARFLDPGGRWGRIEPGHRADLLLVEGNPLEDIEATSRIAGVWKGGVEIRRLR